SRRGPRDALGRELANQMIARHYRVKIELVEQLALVPIVPAHHDLPPPQCFLREWNHRSHGSATDFCNKTGQQAEVSSTYLQMVLLLRLQPCLAYTFQHNRHRVRA